MTSAKTTNDSQKDTAKSKGISASTVVAVLGAIAGLITAIALFLQASVEGWEKLTKFTESPSQVQRSDTLPSSTQSIGWIRLGSVRHESANTGATLEASSPELPVTIVPRNVPKTGDRVTISNSVNVREKPPQPPNFNATDQAMLSYLSSGDTVTIKQVVLNPDKRSINTWAVWAEVGLIEK